MLSRRAFLNAVVVPPAFAWLSHPARAAAIASELSAHPGAAADVALDEDFWSRAAEAFTLDRSLVNFNNGGVSPSPAVVQEALARALAFANEAPAHHMWRIQEPQRETVRRELARLFGADPEEIAITRNASEGLQTCQLGLDLARGDVVLASDQDYPRMLTAFRQRERREGLRLELIKLPVPCEDDDEIVRRYEEAILRCKPRLVLVSHVVFLNGQVLPVEAVVRMARSHGVPVIVDGAHAFAHLVFEQADLDCDYYATSLHKWLFAPFGTGMLYVRRERIAELWPLMAADETQRDDVRKFEEIGTHPCPVRIAISQAIRYHEALGGERKLARLLYLRDRWAKRVVEHERVRLHTSLAPGFAGGFATVEIDGIAPAELNEHLWDEHKFLVAEIAHADFRGTRVSPSVYSTTAEVDRFADVLLDIARNGLPA